MKEDKTTREPSSQVATPEQLKEISAVFTEAISFALSFDEAQRIIERKDELLKSVQSRLAMLAQSKEDLFKSYGEVNS